MLGVATWPHSLVAIHADEATLSRELRTPRSHRGARPGRILRAAPQVMSLMGVVHSDKCMTVTATASCRTRTTRSAAAAGSDPGARNDRGPRSAAPVAVAHQPSLWRLVRRLSFLPFIRN